MLFYAGKRDERREHFGGKVKMKGNRRSPFFQLSKGCCCNAYIMNLEVAKFDLIRKPDPTDRTKPHPGLYVGQCGVRLTVNLTWR